MVGGRSGVIRGKNGYKLRENAGWIVLRLKWPSAFEVRSLSLRFRVRGAFADMSGELPSSQTTKATNPLPLILNPPTPQYEIPPHYRYITVSWVF